MTCKQLGHWECDLIQFRKKFGKANVTSLVEQVSRFTVFLRNNDRQSRSIMDGLIGVLGPLPHFARQSITFDRGTEFTDWPNLQAGLGVQTWFCDPQALWQKGTVENTNRRARRWLSRDTNPLSIKDRDLHEVCAHLNSTPRKWPRPQNAGRSVPAESIVGEAVKPLPCPGCRSHFGENSHPNRTGLAKRRCLGVRVARP